MPIIIRVLPATFTFFVLCLAATMADEPSVARPNAGKSAANGTLFLSASDKNEKTWNRGLLLREVARQALLIAARDELNLSTRDQHLREELVSEGSTQLPVDLVVAVCSPRTLELTIVNRNQGSERVLWSNKPIELAEGFYLKPMVTQCEALSRDEFVKALKQLGFEGKPAAKTDRVELPSGLEAELAQMSIFSQYSAVRRLHADIRENGETASRLQALVRGYANLSMQTDFFWSPAHKVFKARALLYAERLFQRAPGTVEVFWHRAYARAATGVHHWALEDLEAARKIDKTKEPRWVDLIDAFCKFDLARLDAAAAEDGPTAQLAAFLRMVNAEDSGDVKDLLAASQKVLLKSPDCFRAIDAPIQTNQLALRRMFSSAAFQVMQAELHRRLKAITRLPVSAKKVVDDHDAKEKFAGEKPAEIAVRSKLVRALMQDGRSAVDHDEPSWQTLGKLIDELSFIHVWRIIDVQHNALAVSADDSVKSLMPLLVDHPYADFIASHQGDPALAAEAIQRLLAKNDGEDLMMIEKPMLDRIGKFNRERGFEWSLQAWAHDDDIYGDLPRQLRLVHPQGKLQVAKTLWTFAPYAPQSVVAGIEFDWEHCKPAATAGEKRFGHSALVMTSLGKQWKADGELANAERCLRAAAKISPTQESCTTLADFYYEQERYDKWLEALEMYLAEPDYGLGPAHTRDRIARHFIRQHEWVKAQRCAQEAAESGAGWAMLTAASCAEALQEWVQAEQLFRRTGERYASGEFEWYFFCKRTGQGDQAAAHLMALRRVQRNEREQTMPRLYIARFYHLNQQLDKALEIYRLHFKETNDPASGLYAALIADQSKNTQLRDTLLTEIAAKGPLFRRARDGGPRTQVVKLAEMVQGDLNRGGKANLNRLEMIDVVNSPSDGLEQMQVMDLAARYFDQHNKRDIAVMFWKRIMATAEITDQVRTMAGAALWDRAVTPNDYKDALQGPLPPVEDRKQPPKH